MADPFIPESTKPETSEAVELLPCPLCRKPALTGCTFEGDCYVSCMSDQCKCIVGYFDTLAEATAAWNTRASLATPAVSVPVGEVERLQDTLERIIQLTPFRANARDAQDLHCSVRAIAMSALDKSPGYNERPNLRNTDPGAASPNPPASPSVAIGAGEVERARKAVVEQLVEEGRAKHRVLNDDQQEAADDDARAFYRKVIDRFLAALAPASASIPADVEREAETIRHALIEVGFCATLAEATRLIRGGGARLNGEKVSSLLVTVSPGDCVSAGQKHHAVFRAALAARPSTVERG